MTAETKLNQQIEEALKNSLEVRPSNSSGHTHSFQKIIGREATVSVNAETGAIVQVNKTDAKLKKVLLKEECNNTNVETRIQLTKEEREFLSEEGVIPSELNKIIYDDGTIVLSDEEHVKLFYIFSDLELLIGYDSEGYPNGSRGLMIEKLMDKLVDAGIEAEHTD
ncbi:MAG: hypothetical protein GY795_43005 [Desulfobacterales bacterium]|nr:hypothetical protein [Desulfobacterales bacterium]